MNNKKILSSVLLIALVTGLMGTGTYAYFTDSAQSTSNVVNTGTLELTLTDGNPDPDRQWLMIQASPGTIGGAGDIRIHNTGSIEADHVEIVFKLDEHEDNDGIPSNGYEAGPNSDTLLTGTGDMSSYFVVDSMTYQVFEEGTAILSSDGSSIVSSKIILVGYSAGSYFYDHEYLTDYNGNDFIDLYDLSCDDFDGFDDLEPPKANPELYIDYSQLDMSISFLDDGTPQNDFQGDVIDMTVEVTLNQDPSQ